MAASTCCAVAANGACCRARMDPGPPCTGPGPLGMDTGGRGARTGPGNGSTHTTLRARRRRPRGRPLPPSAALLDSPSGKTPERGGPHGYDGAQKLSGRNRSRRRGSPRRGSRRVAPRGVVVPALVHPADLQDRTVWAPAGFCHCSAPHRAAASGGAPLRCRLRRTAANLGLGGAGGWRREIVARPSGRGQWRRADREPPLRLPGFQVLPRRWLVARTIAWIWIGRNRRMSRDGAFLPASLVRRGSL